MTNMKWHYTKENDYPVPRPGRGENDEFQCLVERRGNYMLLYWSCYYQCWDDEQGDDYFCDKEQVNKWITLDDLISELNEKEDL